MSVENVVIVRISATDPAIQTIVRDLVGARSRARKALPGERTDVVRFEQLATQLETLAIRALNKGADCRVVGIADKPGLGIWHPSISETMLDCPTGVDSWLSDGDAAVEIRLPFEKGMTEHRQPAQAVQAPVSVWRSPDGVGGRKAVLARFRHQVQCAMDGEAAAAVVPSGVTNSVLTEVLREFAEGSGPRVDVPVCYRDGSRAQRFPLHCLRFQKRESGSNFRTLRFTLLSIRHMTMDIEVDGAWLRNVDISRRRPAGETDALAYALSRRQFRRLANRTPVLMYLYQTGMEPAVVGFYRALTEHLIEQPGSVSVVPMYFRQRQTEEDRSKPMFAEGTVWTV
jgi:hypothetical protein